MKTTMHDPHYKSGKMPIRGGNFNDPLITSEKGTQSLTYVIKYQKIKPMY